MSETQHLTHTQYCEKGHLACPMRSCKFCKRIFREKQCDLFNANTLTNSEAQANSGATPEKQKRQT